jgi:hypothetical protein
MNTSITKTLLIMKTKKTSNLFLLCFLSLTTMLSGQIEIEYNSSATPEDPHLLLLEVDDAGNASDMDGWARMWFKNADDAINRWGFLARPHTGAVDNQDVIESPLVMAYTGDQKFGFGKDGNLVINKSFVLPNSASASNAGQALIITGNTVGTNSTATTNWGYIDYTEKNSGLGDATLQLHENSNDAANLTFSNNQFANSRFYISADPSNTAGTNASMRLGWGNNTVQNDIITLDGSTNHVGIGVEPYQSFRLHVEGPQAAAHFGPQSAAFPAVGYVTVNRPESNASQSIFRVRDDGTTIADFDDDEITFQLPTTIRDEVKIFNSDLSLLGATPGDISAANGVFSGTVTASCGVLSCSDIRYKKNIIEIPSVLEKLNKISGVYYDWDTENFSDMGFSDDRQVGIIAQELEAIFPELVKTKDDGYKVVAYDKLAPIVLQAVKEQQDIIEQLQVENELMKSQIAEILAKLK